MGISAYAVRPPGISKRKPIVCAYLDGSVDKIKALKPDIVIGFSDVQAELAARLIKAQQQVLIFNQRSIEEIFDVILAVGRLVNRGDRAQGLVDTYRQGLDRARTRTADQSYRPRFISRSGTNPSSPAVNGSVN